MAIMDPFLLACLLLILLAHHLLRKKGAKRSLPLPPGPRGFPIVGALPLVGSAPHTGLAELARRHGPIMYLKLGTSGVVVASTPAAARAFYKTADAQFANRPIVPSADTLTYGSQNMIFGNGPSWKFLRRLSVLHLLSPKSISTWADARRTEVHRLVRSLCESAEAGKPVVVPEALINTTANIMSLITMSKRVFERQGEESNRFKDLLTDMLTGIGLFSIGDYIPSIAWMDLQGVQAKHRRIHERYDAMIAKMLADHAVTAGEREGKPDFVDLLMANREWDGQTLTDTQIRAVIFDVLSAGTDATTIIVEWGIAELVRCPVVLEQAQSEMDQVIGRDRRLEESDLPNLPYLRAVCKETLRLHTSTPLGLPHYTFEECEVDGYYIPKNTRLVVNLWAIGRDPDSWDNPHEFMPERFLSGEGVKIEPHGNDFELIPFGSGRRICIGRHAGLLLVQYILATLVHSFHWRLPDGEELNMDGVPGFTLPKAVRMTAMVTPRLAPAAYV